MTSHSVATYGADRRQVERLALLTGVAGLVGVALLFGSVIPISTLEEPPLEAGTADAAAFFDNAQASWVLPVATLGNIGTLVLLWFMVGLYLLLRRAEGELPWRSTGALASGLLLAVYGTLNASWSAAAHRADDLSPGVLAYAFDLGNIGFTNAWLGMAGFAVGAGLSVLFSGVLPRWTGWWAVVSGVGLLVARFFWTVETAWILPYALFWGWLVTLCVLLLRRPPSLLGVSRS